MENIAQILGIHRNQAIRKSNNQLDEEVAINHMEDADRLEWKECEPGAMDESKISDDMIMHLLPYQIEVYEKGIAPKRLRKMLASRERDDMDCLDEYDRWLNRKWIQKVLLFKELNHFKMFVEFDRLVWNAPTKKGDMWNMTWSAEAELYLNKRRVSIGITCVNFDDEKGYKDQDYTHHYNAIV
eukprot:1152890_1